MPKPTADLLVERLIDWGVDTIFGFPGDGVNDIFETLRTHQGTIRFIQVRHEEAAAFAATGYAKYTGRLGACLATSGPGGIHLLNGLNDAKCDGQPVLAITGHTFHGVHEGRSVVRGACDSPVSAYIAHAPCAPVLCLGPCHSRRILSRSRSYRTYAFRWSAHSDRRSFVPGSCAAGIGDRTQASRSRPLCHRILMRL